MDDRLIPLTEEENRKALRRKVLIDFVKYYSMLTDKEAFAVHKIVIDAKDRLIKEDGYEEVHRDA